MVREGRVFISSGSKPDFGSTYSVQALEVGAQVTSSSSGTTLTVRAGHGFAAGDKVMRGTDVTTFSATNVVDSVTSTTIVMHSAYTVAAGDLLVNLAVDSSTAATPAYDGAGLTVYTTMDYTATATNNTVATDANGRYRYYHKGISIWELVRTGTSLISLYTDSSENTVTGVDSSTDNAVARWDGATGESIQNSVVIVSDTGGVTGVTTLAASAAVTIGTTLGVTGTSTLAAVNASGLVAAAAAVTVGTTLAVTGTSTLAAVNASGLVAAAGAVTVGTTLAVTGNTTLTGSLAKGVSAAITASTTQTQAGGTALTKDINNISVCANANDTVTLPTAVAGMHITLINSGAQTARVYPASGDNLGAGVDTFRVGGLAAAAIVRFVALDATNWKEV